jgi:CRISPR-associated endonuclease Csn1
MNTKLVAAGTRADLQLAFDVGHSSIGWAVLQSVGRASSRAETPSINLLGCGVVTFGADDCLASERRGKRRQRRHIRSTRQRIERMAKLILNILANEKDEGLSDLFKELQIYLNNSLKRAELTKAGTKKNESHPWLLAAKVLAARTHEEKAKSRLTWQQLWDVLRWYAHNRGYDGNIRWSGGFNVEAFSETPLANRKELDAQAEALGDNDPEDDKKKLLAAAVRMEDYGFTTPTFAETVAKFLFGPDRTVKPGGEGKPGIVEPTATPFTEVEFRRLLFNCEPGFESHPRHLRNYFKGVRAAFPRRVIKEINGKPTLVCGTEWEVRYILRSHFGHLKHCNAALEQVLCGGIPESVSDWSALKPHFPNAYISDADIAKLSKLKVSKKLPKAQKQPLINERRKILEGKLALPSRYHGGLLFGQLVPRFDNRIIEQCPFTFAAAYQAILENDEAALKPYKLALSQIASSRRQVKGEEESDEALAKRWATKLAKVPGKNCLEFLDYRWVMTLANIRIGFDGETYRNADGKDTSLRPLKPDERLKIDAEARKRGYLKVEPDKAGKDGHVRAGKNELREIVIQETKCNCHNLDALLLVPDIKEALRILPVKGSKEAFQIAWGAFDSAAHDKNTGAYHDDPLRHRFASQLLRGKKDEPRFLTIAEIIRQLKSPDVVQRHPAAAAVVARMEEAARKEASDKRGNLNEAKLAELLNAKFTGERLKGRARFGRLKLREAVQQVMHKDSPLHPLEKGGCLEQTDAIKDASIQKSMAELTNNHLVRHRLLILTGDQQNPSDKKRKQGLLDHIIQEFANGDKKLISRITIELARDLQTMSGMDNKAKAKELYARHENHDTVSKELAEKLVGVTDRNGNPVQISAGLIKKARIASDLDWICPYTRQLIEPADLVRINPRQLTNHAVQKDHVIPRTNRLSDALEAQVITFAEVNMMKQNRTALQFIKEFGGQPVKSLPNLHVRTEAQFREFVNNLWPSETHIKRARAMGRRLTDDEARCWRRKQLMLTEKWEEKEFTPGDLTKTRHLVKLAAQQLERAFHDVPKEQRPPVISINGAVTAAFRDKTWKLIRELAAVHPEVKKAADEEQQAKEQGRDYNLKKKIREITNLHHAVDAIALGLVTNLLVPAGHGSLNNELVRLIIKTKLTAEERRRFEEMRHQFGLPKFYQWAADRCEDPEQERPAAGAGGILCLNELPREVKSHIQHELKKTRIAQHIPSDQGGIVAEENTRRLKKIEGAWAFLEQRGRDEKTGISTKKTTKVAKEKLVGLHPDSKLAAQKGVLVVKENYGLALTRWRENQGTPLQVGMEVIPLNRAYKKIAEFHAKFPKGHYKLVRKGTLIRLITGLHSGQTWMVFGVDNKQKEGPQLKIAKPDIISLKTTPELNYKVLTVRTCWERLEVLPSKLVGIPEDFKASA